MSTFWCPGQRVSNTDIGSNFRQNEPTATSQDQSFITASDRGSNIIAICADGSRSGCAIYSNSRLKLVADRKDSIDPHKHLDLVIQLYSPSILVVSSVQKRFINFLEKRFRYELLDLSSRYNRKTPNTQPTQSQTQTVSQAQDGLLTQMSSVAESHTDRLYNVSPFTLVVVPNTWFCMSKGIKRLYNSEMVKSKGCETIEEKTLFISSKVKKSVDVCAVRCIAAIGDYMDYMNVGEVPSSRSINMRESQKITFEQNNSAEGTQEVPESSCSMAIIDVTYVEPGPILSIDRLTLEALSILPNGHKRSDAVGTPNSSEDITCPTLYELLNLCKSYQGKSYLQSMMAWPLQNLDELRFRHDLVQFFMTPDGNQLRDQLALQIKSVVPLEGLLSRMSNAVAKYKDISVLYRALWAFVSMIDLLKESSCRTLELPMRIILADSDQLRQIVDSVLNSVDFDSSRKERRVQLCHGFDENVDAKRELVNNMPQYCDDVAMEETRRYKDVLAKQFRVLYIPRIGFLNAVDYISSVELAKIRSHKEFDVLLHTEESIYFKTKRMEELDQEAGDVACDLIDVQEGIMVRLQEDILKHTEGILKLMELFGELDCLMAFSTVSQQRGYVRPEFVLDADELQVTQAYHPLHSVKSNIIPNDINFFNAASQRNAKVMIITGPNSCGKTTYMKTLCLIIYMAHIGCFVPASQVVLPVFDSILTRLSSRNSVSNGLSSFGSDLYQVKYALERATNRSLVVIDEFGRGTLAQDGFALLVALVTYFATKANQSPFIMVSTHFGGLADRLSNLSEYILYKTFKMTRDRISNNFIYEYKLINGVSETSLADKVAERANVPQHVIRRATEIRGYITGSEQIRPSAPRAA